MDRWDPDVELPIKLGPCSNGEFRPRWHGSPQDQIQAFRAFEISSELQEQFGSPALTPAIKRKILGENAMARYGVDEVPGKCTFTRDELATLRVSTPTPWKTHGPPTDAQLAALLADHGMV
jgi:hypothetical protein